MSHSGVRKDNVQPSFFLPNCVKQVVKIGGTGHISLNAPAVLAELLHGGVQLRLPPPSDKNVGAFFDEALGSRQANSTGSPGDEGDLPVKLEHFMFSDFGRQVLYLSVKYL